MKTENHHNQDTAVECGVITHLIKNTLVNVIIDRVNLY